LVKSKKELNNIKGISNVDITRDFENYIFKLKFNFDDVNTLNEAQLELSKIENKIGQPISYTYTKEGFGCVYSKELLKKADNELVKYKLGELRSADVITIFRFDKKVKSCSSTSCKISKNGKTTFNKISAAQFIENKQNQSLTVTFE